MIHVDRQKLGRVSKQVSLFFLLLMGQICIASAEDQQSGLTDPSGVSDVVALNDSDLSESSGLAVSNRNQDYFWSHNDSGSEARLYAFDRHGRKSGHIHFRSTTADDWEDMAGYLENGAPRLLIADCGDNDSNRSHVRLYLFDEPDPTHSTTLDDRDIQSIRLTYPDGPRDCEAVAVDVTRGVIILVTKTKFPLCGVYTIPLPRRDANTGDFTTQATRVTTLPIPMVTAVDIDPENGDFWIVSYFHTFCYRCQKPRMRLAQQFMTLPQAFELPRWRQIEAVAIDRSHNVWVTSEGDNPPLGRLSPEALAAQGIR